MAANSTARRARARTGTRTALAVLAGAALLSVSACGGSADDDGSADDGGGDAQEQPMEASDGGNGDGSDEDSEDTTEADDAGSSGSTGSSDGGSAQDDGVGAGAGDPADADGSGQEGEEGTGDGSGSEGDDAADGRTQIMLVTDLPGDDQTGDGWPVLSPDELATTLAEPFDGTATCEEELELAPGRSATCTGPASMDMTEPEQEWTAQAARVPVTGELGEGGAVAVLFTTGDGLTGPADVLLDEGTELTGLGFGSMFGSEDLSAQELEESTLQTLTSENAYVPVAEADWESVTCEDGLSFEAFEPSPCTGETADGETYPLHVAPGTYVDNDQGLLVGIARSDAG